MSRLPSGEYAEENPLPNEILMPPTKKAYLEKHQLREIVTATMTELLGSCPDDPYGHLVEEFAKHASDAPVFEGMRATAFPLDDQIKCTVLVAVRGLTVRAHQFAVPRSLFDPPPQDEEAAQPPAGDEAAEEGAEPARVYRPRTLEELAKLLREAVGDQVLKGTSLHAIGELQKRLLTYLQSANYGDLHPDTAAAAAAELLEQLLLTAGSATCTSILGFAQQYLQHSRVDGTPPLAQAQDFEVWERARIWPSFGFEVLSGGEAAPLLKAPSLRICLALSAFAAAAPGSAAAERCVGAGMGDLAEVPALNFADALTFLGSTCLEQAKARILADKAAASLVDASQTPAVLYAAQGLEQGVEFVRSLAEAAVPEHFAASAGAVVLAMADEFWDPEAEKYEPEQGQPLPSGVDAESGEPTYAEGSWEALVEYYVGIYNATGGFLKAIVNPFHAGEVEPAWRALQERCPLLALIRDFGPEGEVPLVPEEISRPFPWSYVLHTASVGGPAGALKHLADRGPGFPRIVSPEVLRLGMTSPKVSPSSPQSPRMTMGSPRGSPRGGGGGSPAAGGSPRGSPRGKSMRSTKPVLTPEFGPAKLWRLDPWALEHWPSVITLAMACMSTKFLLMPRQVTPQAVAASSRKVHEILLQAVTAPQ